MHVRFRAPGEEWPSALVAVNPRLLAQLLMEDFDLLLLTIGQNWKRPEHEGPGLCRSGKRRGRCGCRAGGRPATFSTSASEMMPRRTLSYPGHSGRKKSSHSVRSVQVCQHSGLGADLATHDTPLKRVGGINAATGTDKGRRSQQREFCPKWSAAARDWAVSGQNL